VVAGLEPGGHEREGAVAARAIGTWGTGMRLLVGGFLVGSVAYGSVTGDGSFEPESWLVGLVGFPGLLLTWQVWRARRKPGRLVAATGPVGHLLTLVIFLGLYATAWYAPPIGFVSDAALVFFGTSMLLAAFRGYAGCEVLSISNWVLRRDDQVGCVLFDHVDRLEGRRGG
jgi:hypothetical protein